MTGPGMVALRKSYGARRCDVCDSTEVCGTCPGSEAEHVPDIDLCLAHIWSAGSPEVAV